MKDYDIAQWKCSINSADAGGTTYPICTTYTIAGSLPGGAGAIVDGTDDALCDVDGEICVIVQWVDSRDGGTASVSLRTRAD